jgi:RNA polymerase sigma-70 factor (ECF subfamily)
MVVEDPDAATAFVRRFQAQVFGLAVAVTRDRTLAEDVAQEAFLRAWRAAPTFDRARGSVAGWLLTITRNVAIDAVRARRSDPTDDDELDRLLHLTLTGEDTAEVASTAVEAARALATLRRGPPEQARAVVLAVHEGIPLGTAKTRIRTGLRRLRATSAAGAAGAATLEREDT